MTIRNINFKNYNYGKSILRMRFAEIILILVYFLGLFEGKPAGIIWLMVIL
jgi:hypothetical protein